MQIPLNQFEEHIASGILSKGLSYFKNGLVQEPDAISNDLLEFIVEGTEDYTVQLKIENDVITEFVCNCPYDSGPVCKHVAAAIFYLQQDELDIKPKAKKTPKSAPKKRKTIADQVQELLDNLSHEDLKKFVAEEAAKDRQFRNFFLATFAVRTNNESKSLYTKQVKAILSSAKVRGFIPWNATGYVGSVVYQLINNAEKQLNENNYKSAFYICTAIMEEMVEALQFADDSRGDISGNIDAAQQLLQKMAETSTDEDFKKMLLDYCFTTFDSNKFWEWHWHHELLQIASVLVVTEQEMQDIFARLQKLVKSRYETEIAQSIKFNVILRLKGEAEADKFLMQHIGNSKFRSIAIQKATDKKDFDKAIQLAKEGIEYDKKERPGLVTTWHNWLLKIAQVQEDKQKIIEYAYYLYVDNFMPEQDYYQILKNTIEPQNWPEFVEKIIADISKNGQVKECYRVADIYVKEQYWPRLLEFVQENNSLYTLYHYDKYLIKDNTAIIIDLYDESIKEFMVNNVGRGHYQSACKYITHMIKSGGREKAMETISFLKTTYPQRRALQEELKKI